MLRNVLVVALALSCACKTKSEDKPQAPTTPRDASVAAHAPDAHPAEHDHDEVSTKVVPDSAPAQRLWTPKLADSETFQSYSKEIGNERFAKFVIDLKSDAIYYFDVNVYAVHKDFIFQALWKKERTKEATKIFDRNYGKDKTDFLMCYLVHHLSQNEWTFAFWDGDLATSDHVRHAYKRMKETFYLADKVRFRPDSNYQEDVAKHTPDVPFILNDQLYKLQAYTAFNKGSSVGTLRIVPADVPESELTFAPDEIVVLHSPLSDITPVAGIISETFSTPLSHLSLRAKGWKIPNIGLRDATTKLAALAGKLVYFEAKDADYVVREATAAEIAEQQARVEKRHHVVPPRADLSTFELATLDTLKADDIHRYGAKATNLGVIVNAKVKGVKVPPGFGVPYAFYDRHLKANGIDKQIAAAFADPDFAKDANVRKTKLAAIRKAIIDAPFDDDGCAKVTEALGQLVDTPETGVFVRSSHNAEDLPDFSAAGIYDTMPNVRGGPAVCSAIKEVWGSIWKPTAYEARHLASIDESKVYGAVLVQIGVDATAAGVLATIHPTDPSDERNYTINAKSGLGMAVVDGRKVPESLLVSWYNHGIRVLSRSDEDTKLVFDENGGVHEVPNPNKGKPVLTNSMAIRLVDAAKRLTRVFKNKKLDIEWVFAGVDLYIVQTRPLVNL
jgi:pyruvate phosphate dikinase-like enzyme